MFRSLLFVLPLLAGCGVPWTVITQSGPPSALMGKTNFGVSDDWSKLSIGGKTEAAYLSEKDAQTQSSFAGDKQGMSDEFRKELQARSSGLTFTPGTTGDATITTQWTFIEPGVFTAVFNMPTQVTARVAFAVGGTTVDEAEFKAYEDATITTPSSGQRMRDCADQIGQQVASFIARAQSGK